MAIRLIAVDLDGTLLNTQTEISARNREAIQSALSLGITVVVVTGRRFHSARPFVEQVAGDITVISSNGARIGSVCGEVYYRNFLPSADFRPGRCDHHGSRSGDVWRATGSDRAGRG